MVGGPEDSYDSLLAIDHDSGRTQTIADRACQAVWSPDGKQLAYIDGDSSLIVDIVTFTGDTYTTKKIVGRGNYVEGLVWQPGSDR